MNPAPRIRRSGPARRPVVAPDPRARILDAFAARAHEVGIRGVVMGELAADLGMSKKTLYLHFESKDALVLALVVSWGARLEDGLRTLRARAASPMAYFRETAELWVDSLSRFSPAFWAELRRDHPSAHAAFVAVLHASRQRTRARVGQDLRPGVSLDLALELLNAAIARAADPAVSARLGMPTREALLGALEIWARGALRLGSRKVPLRTISRHERKRP